MKKTFVILIIIIITITACHKKAMPTITSRPRESTSPTMSITDIKPDMELGKTIFTNRCGRCHALPDPVQYTTARWDGILRSMIPKARLNPEQGVHVTAYLQANAKK